MLRPSDIHQRDVFGGNSLQMDTGKNLAGREIIAALIIRMRIMPTIDNIYCYCQVVNIILFEILDLACFLTPRNSKKAANKHACHNYYPINRPNILGNNYYVII